MNPFVNIAANGEAPEFSAEDAERKQARLLAILAKLPSLIVALSGGADSACLAWAAHTASGERALGVTALSDSYSKYDREQLEQFVAATGIRHEFVVTRELENPQYRANAGNRC